ncbi:MAG TPA: hypothetical protein VMP03_10140 [Methylomirabilota bacterium]|nr:hypothetical protein [Methylomirabilota bacterium]
MTARPFTANTLDAAVARLAVLVRHANALCGDLTSDQTDDLDVLHTVLDIATDLAAAVLAIVEEHFPAIEAALPDRPAAE